MNAFKIDDIPKTISCSQMYHLFYNIDKYQHCVSIIVIDDFNTYLPIGCWQH